MKEFALSLTSTIDMSPSSTKVLSTVGLGLSLYALYVEHKIENKARDEDFQALCDIEAINASCSTVFTLPVGKLLSYFGVVPSGHFLDVPNAALGVAYYTWRLLLDEVSPPMTTLVTILSFSSSVFLAYQLTFVLGDLCILCWSAHVINTALLIQRLVRTPPAKVKAV